jgi:hypothetical protein
MGVEIITTSVSGGLLIFTFRFNQSQAWVTVDDLITPRICGEVLLIDEPCVLL